MRNQKPRRKRTGYETALFVLDSYAPRGGESTLYEIEQDTLSFNGVLDMLLAMANCRLMLKTSMMHSISYPSDTLSVLTKNQGLIVAQSVDLGKRWQADSADICDGSSEEEDWKFRDYVSIRLLRALGGRAFERDRDAMFIKILFSR